MHFRIKNAAFAQLIRRKKHWKKLKKRCHKIGGRKIDLFSQIHGIDAFLNFYFHSFIRSKLEKIDFFSSRMK